MANCPKCGYKLKFTDFKPECPGCGVNLMYYNHQERLAEDADKAEAEHVQMQPKVDRIKFAFIGTKLSIVVEITRGAPHFLQNSAIIKPLNFDILKIILLYVFF